MWLAFRLALLVLPVVIWFLLPFSTTSNLPVGYQPNPNPLLDHVIRGWMRWDGGFYVDVARGGYLKTPAGDAAAAFFPLYPHLMRAFALVFEFGNFHNESLYVAGIIVSSVATLAAFVGLYQLANLDYDPITSRLAVTYLAAFPMAFFLLAVYTESLFMALAVWAFWAARRNYWGRAGLLTGLAILTKNQGLLLAVALGLEYLAQIGFNLRRLDRRVFSFVLPGLALAGWWLVNWLTFGTPLRYIQVQDLFARSFKLPWETLWLGTQEFFQERSPGSMLPTGFDPGSILYDYPITLFFILMLIVGGWLAGRGGLRWSYWLFFLLCLIQPLSQPARDTWLAGMPRFLLIIFPVFLVLALVGRRWPTFHYLYLAVSLPLLGLFLARFVLNYWVA